MIDPSDGLADSVSVAPSFGEEPLDEISDVAVLPDGNILAPDQAYNVIWSINLATGRYFSLLGHSAFEINFPLAIAVDTLGNSYLASGDLIVKIDTLGNPTTMAGITYQNLTAQSTPATNVALINPGGVAVDLSGNIYISDSGNDAIRKLYPDGTITTIAGGNGSGYSATVDQQQAPS